MILLITEEPDTAYFFRGARWALVHHALNRLGDLTCVVDVLFKNGTLRQRGNGVSFNAVPPRWTRTIPKA